MIIHNQRGIALILTIAVISLLVVITVQFGLGMRREYLSSVDQRDGTLALSIASSGLNIATEILAWDGKTTNSDSYWDSWNRISSQDLSPLFDRGRLHVAIADLSGRLQINSLVAQKKGQGSIDEAIAKKTQNILKRLLLSGKFGAIQEEQAEEIVDSLVDWIDADDQVSPYGAEQGYYRSLDSPYDCKNAPVTFVQELLLVRGMSKSILYGTKDHEGLASYISAQGDDGKININTADPLLLQAMAPRMTVESAIEMVDFRSDQENKEKISSPTWYKEITEWPSNLVLDQDEITTKSNFFVITSVGEIGSSVKKEEAYVKRGKQGIITLLSKKVE